MLTTFNPWHVQGIWFIFSKLGMHIPRLCWFEVKPLFYPLLIRPISCVLCIGVRVLYVEYLSVSLSLSLQGDLSCKKWANIKNPFCENEFKDFVLEGTSPDFDHFGRSFPHDDGSWLKIERVQQQVCHISNYMQSAPQQMRLFMVGWSS